VLNVWILVPLRLCTREVRCQHPRVGDANAARNKCCILCGVIPRWVVQDALLVGGLDSAKANEGK